MAELRIVLMGKTGAGKSASGNKMLRTNAFKEGVGYESVSHTCEKQRRKLNGRKITVVDTPGLFDTKMSVTDLKKELEKCVTMSLPGPHVFLLVIRLDVRFTEEERNVVEWIKENFGERAAQFTMVLFTRADQLDDVPLEKAIKYDKMKEILTQCGGGYHAFSNKEKGDSTQVDELLHKIDAMVDKNGGEYYTNKMYQEAQGKAGATKQMLWGVAGGAVWGAVSGACTGAVIGSVVGPIGVLVGTGVGTFVGTVGGAVGGVIGGRYA